MSRADKLGSLGSMFERSVQGRTLILDADFPAYQAAATVKKLTTAVSRFQTLVETERFVVGAERVEVHITQSRCTKCRRFDYPTAKPYQANRDKAVRPALLMPLRDYIATAEWPEHWSVFVWQDREADDGMMMQAVRYGHSGVISSGDKDLCITPGPYLRRDLGVIDHIDNRFGWIAETFTDGGTRKVEGHGTKFFWAQMLMGDTADNVQGIRRYNGALCGPRGALDVLLDVRDESEAANIVLRAYAKIQQDPLAEAQCLWLRRSNDDCAYRYLTELDLAPDLRGWIDSLHQYHQEYLAYVAAMRDLDNGYEPIESAGTETSGTSGGLDLPWE